MNKSRRSMISVIHMVLRAAVFSIFIICISGFVSLILDILKNAEFFLVYAGMLMGAIFLSILFLAGVFPRFYRGDWADGQDVALMFAGFLALTTLISYQTTALREMESDLDTISGVGRGYIENIATLARDECAGGPGVRPAACEDYIQTVKQIRANASNDELLELWATLVDKYAPIKPVTNPKEAEAFEDRLAANPSLSNGTVRFLRELAQMTFAAKEKDEVTARIQRLERFKAWLQDLAGNEIFNTISAFSIFSVLLARKLLISPVKD